MDCNKALEAVNRRLKAGRHRCQIEQRRAALYLRATLPDREDPAQRRQQRIPLALPALLTSLPEAERLAMELGHQLREGSFHWAGWTHESQPESVTLDQFLQRATTLHTGAASTWRAQWLPALRKLPISGEITPAVLRKTIEGMRPCSASRRDQGCVLAQIAGTFGWNADILRQAAKGYSARQLSPRDIPEDDEIEAIYDRLRAPHWKWAWGMLATFGLRPHELASLQWLESSWVQVAASTKTGSRRVTACPSAWIERFSLRNTPRPNQPAGALAGALSDYLRSRGVRLPAYNLRHAYALRLMENGVPPELGARLMGHSLVMHEVTYKRWLDANRIKTAMSKYKL